MPACLRVHVRRLIALVLAGVLALVLAWVATPAIAAGTGQITGTVTGPGGAALPGISVGAYEVVMEPRNWGLRTAPVSTDAAGDYDLSHLEPGTYRLRFWDPSGEHADEYWDDAATVELATDIVVGDAEVPAKDAELALPSRISGTVTGPGGTGLQHAHVTAYQKSPDSDWEWDWDEVMSTSTNAAGEYDLAGLRVGTYRVGFSHLAGGHLPEYWEDAVTRESATDIVVGEDSPAEGIDAELALPSHISGTVSGPDGVGLPNVSVTAHEKRVMGPEEVWGAVSGPLVKTNASGEYVIPGLRAGAYRLSFSDWTGRHVMEYWDNAANVQTATDITVTENEPAEGIDADLAHPSRITGKVTGPDGAGLPYVYVTAYQREPGTDAWTSVLTSRWTNAAGEYDLSGLRAGTYRLRFDPNSPGHISEYWDDAATVEAATDIVVGEAVTVSGKNAELAVGEASAPDTNTAPPGSVTAAPTPTQTPTVTPTPIPSPTPTPEADPASAVSAILAGLAVKGRAKVGKTLKIEGLDASFRTAVAYKITWYAAKKKIKKATKPKLKLTKALRGKVVFVKVKATADGVTQARRIRVGKVK